MSPFPAKFYESADQSCHTIENRLGENPEGKKGKTTHGLERLRSGFGITGMVSVFSVRATNKPGYVIQRCHRRQITVTS